MSKSNYELLQSNSEQVLAYADSIPYTQKSISQRDIAAKLKSAKSALSEPGGLTKAIRALDEIKDNKLGIIWHESNNLDNGTKALVRDARNVTTDPELLKEDAGEKYAMQILNEIGR